jgi:hypothetical protein
MIGDVIFRTYLDMFIIVYLINLLVEITYNVTFDIPVKVPLTRIVMFRLDTKDGLLSVLVMSLLWPLIMISFMKALQALEEYNRKKKDDDVDYDPWNPHEE